jgi:hypothetical protein
MYPTERNKGLVWCFAHDNVCAILLKILMWQNSGHSNSQRLIITIGVGCSKQHAKCGGPVIIVHNISFVQWNAGSWCTKSRWHKISGCTYKTGNVSTYNITLGRFRVTNCCHVKRGITYSEFSCSARKAHALYYTVICGLCGSSIFYHIFS